MIIPINIVAETPLHLGSGKGDVLIDAEVVHDEYGLPYLPAKRFKGVLYESALEVVEMLEQCGKDEIVEKTVVDKLFGRSGAESCLAIHDLYLADYQEQRAAWAYLQDKFPGIVNANDVLEEYTELRYQTSIDKETGITADGSLHNMRVVDKGNRFVGELELFAASEKEQLLLALALQNLHYIGGKRNRGFGKIHCELTTEQKKLIKRNL